MVSTEWQYGVGRLMGHHMASLGSKHYLQLNKKVDNVCCIKVAVISVTGPEMDKFYILVDLPKLCAF